VVDDYHGTRVADPYRWLEEADSRETVRWVAEENALVREYVDGPARDAIRRRLAELYDYPRLSVPELRGGRYFYFRNTGLQDQSVLFVREDGRERVLLDPNTLSEDGTVALTLAAPTRDGRLLAYAISRSGSDRQEILVRDVETGRDLPDRVLWAKFTGISWTPRNEGFYYTRFPEPGTVPAGDESYFGKAFYHRLGRPQEEDALVYERPEDKELFPSAAVTRDGRWLVLSTAKGASGKAGG
jgi:prolyl oligopeptidase